MIRSASVHLPRALAALTPLAAAPAAAQGTLRGTVHAPARQDLRGAVVVACYARQGRCDYAFPHPRSRAVRIGTRGSSAAFVLRGLQPREYVLLGTRDVNGNGVEDDGDWIAQEPGLRPVRPPAEGIRLRFRYRTPPAPTARRGDPAPPAAPGRGRRSGIYEDFRRVP